MTQSSNTRLDALSVAIRENDAMLLRWLTGKLSDPDLARDIAQSTYLRVWRHAQANDIINPKALLFRTAANLTANEFRARGVRRQHERAPVDSEGNALADSVPSDDPTPERAASARSDAVLSIEVIRGMPENVRRAFVMNRFEGRTYSEIAEALGVSVSSVEKYIISALKTLRQAVEDGEAKGCVIPILAHAPKERAGRDG